MDADLGGGAPRKRISTACEACRATKVRCRPSGFPGVCQKCHASKRECISRTGPRLRRAKKHCSRSSEQEALQEPAAARGPSSTFSIDFSVAAPAEADNSADSLREAHEQILDRLFPDDAVPPETYQLTSPATSSDAHTSSSTPTNPPSLSMHQSQAKPQLNLASAESLLHAFRTTKLEMLPCIVLPPDVTVRHLATARPFVLLAIMTAASGTKSVQGHTLYNDEFRKVLGLKYVTGGERSLELLQSILLYCAWYPYHLRPRDKQGLQYMRMAWDLINDLKLNREPPPDTYASSVPLTDDQLDGVRAYLAYVYLTTTHIVSWKVRVSVWGDVVPWTMACCDLLERNARVEGDLVLAALGRVSCVLSEACQVTHVLHHEPQHHRSLVLSGLALRLAEMWSAVMPSMAVCVPFNLHALFVDLHFDCGSLLRIPRAAYPSFADGVLPLVASKLRQGTAKLCALLRAFTLLEETALLNFTLEDWMRFILVIILALRLSFPMPECSLFDTACARLQLRLDDFLVKMRCTEDVPPETANNIYIVAASRVVLSVIIQKYRRRLRALRDTEAATAAAVANDKQATACPMFGGLLDAYLPMWDATMPQQLPEAWAAGPVDEAGLPILPLPDLWATMTTNWAADEEGV